MCLRRSFGNIMSFAWVYWRLRTRTNESRGRAREPISRETVLRQWRAVSACAELACPWCLLNFRISIVRYDWRSALIYAVDCVCCEVYLCVNTRQSSLRERAVHTSPRFPQQTSNPLSLQIFLCLNWRLEGFHSRTRCFCSPWFLLRHCDDLWTRYFSETVSVIKTEQIMKQIQGHSCSSYYSSLTEELKNRRILTVLKRNTQCQTSQKLQLK